MGGKRSSSREVEGRREVDERCGVVQVPGREERESIQKTNPTKKSVRMVDHSVN